MKTDFHLYRTYLGLTILIIAVCSSCNSSRSNDITPLVNNDEDVMYIVDEDSYDWTPEGFREEHYDEWNVVHQAITLHQKHGQAAFPTIDSLVKEYIKLKGINLSENSLKKILQIEDICKSRFDIEDYDTSNMGMHIADGASRIFEKYVMWLYSSEVSKCRKTGIDIEEEERLFEGLMDSFKICWEILSGSSEGSGAWVGWSNIDRMGHTFKMNMYEAILSPYHVESMPLLLKAEHFETECALRLSNYKPDVWNETPVETVKASLDAYSGSMTEWLNYRKRSQRHIRNRDLRQDYGYITRIVARKHYIHLKNIFGDLGLMSPLQDDICLREDCTDEQMLEYNYEEEYEKYISR